MNRLPCRPEALLNLAASVVAHGQGVLDFAEQAEEPLPFAVEELHQLRRVMRAIAAIPGMQARVARASNLIAMGEQRVGVSMPESIRKLRTARGWSQAELAKKCGVSQQQIARLEAPACNPSVETLGEVAKALGRKLSIRFVAVGGK
jgi:HTH-type transcriptional regulator / antitoxin HipB